MSMTELTLDADALVAAARAVDGLEDFGDDSYREPLERLLWSLVHEADLNAIGRPAMAQRMLDILSTRLRVQEWLRRHPEIRDEQIVEPLVIVGLPRTGTTMLHRTIAADNRMYAPLWYETRFPCPDLDWDFTAAGDRRIRDAKAEVKMMVDSNPDLLSVHPLDAMEPDEDIMLLEQSFYSFNIQALANVPSFDAWVEAQDHTIGYEYLKLLLQFLQWQKKRSGQRGERWALKAPHHLHYMDLVFRIFPDARVVQSHRDPVETERFLDLWFKDTVSQPMVEIGRVYDFLGMDLTPEASVEMSRWQDSNRRELRPAHAYTLDQFGLTEEGLKAQFKGYREAFILDK